MYAWVMDVGSSNSDLYEVAVSRVESPALVQVANCSVCGATRASPRFEIEEFESVLVICSGCGLGRLEPLPSEEALKDLYPAEYYGEGAGQKFHPLVEWLVRLVGARQAGFLSRGFGSGSRVLDLGCGRGVMLTRLADQGFEVHGADISEEATRGVDPRAEIRIAPNLAAAGYPDDFFDLVIVWHVLEHLRDPASTLKEIRRILRPGGRLIVAVPNFSSLQARLSGRNWFHLDLPRHLYHFPLKGLERLLVSAGFEVLDCHHFSLRQNPFGWIQSALNGLSFFPRNALYTLLYTRSAGAVPLYDLKMRSLLWFCLILGAPFALAASVAETVLRSGATVHVVATAPNDGQTPGAT